MPKRGVAALAITTVALILLISFKVPDAPVLDRTTGNLAIVEPSAVVVSGGTTTPETGTAAATPAPAATGSTDEASGTSGSTTVDGPVVSTRFGPVQVEVVISNGHVADVVALQLPSGRRSGQISDYSEPILREEALQAQSANIDVVSGATYTSDAYAESLQAALDQAGIG
ncbi:MAG TPA: FMN-binding protein [Candidatus Limnocylindrales bacterium]